MLTSQITGKVINEETKEPIPYVNIWVQGEDMGTTSAENGNFVLDINSDNLSLVFSAIGFETKSISVSENLENITLQPKFTELQEVIVSASKENKETIVGKFKRSKISRFFGASNQPKIWARHFPYRSEYDETSFLKFIKIFTISNDADCKFNIRFYSVKDDGSPGEFFYGKNIIATAKKGNKITEVNISDLNISFPVAGLFVAFEWLIVEENKYEYTYKEGGKKFNDFGYNPSLGTISVETNANGWMFFQGKWQKVEKNYFSEDKGKGKEIYSVLAIELTLSN
ncbi:MAG: carboxypeptidase-like regulatory domain-containing protein [Maribacter sp.]